MAPSTPPPPHDPSTTTTRPLFPRPPSNPQQPFYSPTPSRLPSNPNPNYPQLAPRPPHIHPHDPSQLLYPLASSGRGFLSRPVSRPSHRPQVIFPYSDPGQGNPGFIRPTHLPPHLMLGSGTGGGGGVMPGVVKGVPISSSQHPKVGPPSASVPDSNGHNDLRNMDDALAIVRDRKVRIHENDSLYALCRSWLKNGFPEETQPQYMDAVKSLPRPLPVAAQVVDSPDKKEVSKEEEDEDEGSVEHLSAKELLQRHVKRAKRVRLRLKEERLQRITRYKTRLALLLPPMVEQHFKNESTAAN
ncbi:hypothetical protein ACJIZ3_016304 [Penstemon smallii]|uniref:Uncharacterized protein n=1 Tax=Penstemon smallii TaxID=265156 RepID=A0ABD3RU26_9LAMI